MWSQLSGKGTATPFPKPSAWYYVCGAETCRASETFLFWTQLNGCKVGLSTAPFSQLLYLQTLAHTLQLWRFHTFSLRPSKINSVEVHMWHLTGCFWTVNVLCEIFDFGEVMNLQISNLQIYNYRTSMCCTEVMIWFERWRGHFY